MDMELYIEVDEQGNCVNHPILGDNLRDALGIEPKNGHPKYEPFICVPKPDNYIGDPDGFPTYQKIDGVWKNIWVNP
jgi:hypothetical protein